ncbi:hypothetical protein, partial [Sansalvadorimonas verongulae]|uniref:hypothetical protein n=1 Tax=Sansalvadorimonas verongulae TaxID=2172824 RepID=UPI001E2EF5F9
MEAMDFETGINWPACWQELQSVLNQPVASYCQKAPEVSTQLTDVMDTQAQLLKPAITTLDSGTNYKQLPAQQAQLPQSVIKTLDSRTKYEQLPASCISYKKVFQTVDHDPRMTRLHVYDIAATP